MRTTGSPKVNVVGFSLGSAIVLIGGTLRPEFYNAHVSDFVAYAPSYYFRNVKSGFYNKLFKGEMSIADGPMIPTLPLYQQTLLFFL